ncbi:hypothetical protein VaNZ11_009064 [Volvox africanus]|uniref:Uncharacterized protein n=1 Tax=Volvox africanus TaxID=51714 RepID=A0ABQ5S7M9_9CHLO|nr:hypothetical protein VaNZ11_009064 [Volvox africanus]
MTARRRALASRLAAAVLILIFGGAAIVRAVNTTLCVEVGMTLPDNPEVKEFLKCANPVHILPSCCRHLLTLTKYYDCLTVPAFVDRINRFLNGKTTVNGVQQDCVS